MQNGGTNVALDHLLDPVADAFSYEVAQALVNLASTDGARAHIADLAAKANAGLLSPAEQAEYHSYISAVDMVGVLQSKARAWLDHHDIMMQALASLH